MLNRQSYILLFCGLLGVISYFILRAEIDINAKGPINESKSTVEEKLKTLSAELNFSLDSLSFMTVRTQHINYLEQLRDTLKDEFSLSKLNENGAHIQGWKTIIGKMVNSQSIIASPNQLFDNVGNLKILFSNEGELIRLHSHPENTNPTFLRGDSLKVIAEHLVGNIFQYNLENYELLDEPVSSTTFSSQEISGAGGTLNTQQETQSLEISWVRKSGITEGPGELQLQLEPIVREFDNEEGFRTEFGYRVQSFVAKDDLEPVDFDVAPSANDNEMPWANYAFFISVIILAVLIFSVGLRNIFKGKVEWRRALIVFGVIAASIYSWRAIYFMYSYNPFLDNAAYFSTVINNLLFALVVGLYSAMAYISWEALARSQKQKQIEIIDALWQRKIFVRETGSGIIHGFAMGGIAVGVISLLTYMIGDYFIQSDSQFGFAEASINPKLLTINISVLSTTFLVCVGQIGFVYSILNQWLKRKWLVSLLSIVFITIFVTILGRQLGTSGEIIEDVLLYFGVTLLFVYAILEFGLWSVCIGWWFFISFFLIQPYWASPEIEVAYVGWAQAFIMAGPLIFGFLAYKYGVPVSEVGNYIPEYEERMAQHLRVEKEIEIARESQYKLMPLQPPKIDGIDVYGFFLPSFEVGGDYFDYILSEDENGTPIALNMAIVDVSGKAMRAAMPAVFTSGLLLSRMKENMPADILSIVSEPIFARTDKRTFITCALARYNFQTKQISIANAGHCRPILKRNGVAEFIQTPDPKYPLGIKPDVKYKAQEFTLKKGDFFLMYSDGLPEAVNEKGIRFGFDEVPRLIEQIDTENLSAHEIAQELKRTVQKFSNYQLADDTTIICLKV